MPPRGAPRASGMAPAGGATGTLSVPSTCASVACWTVTGTAGTTFCASASASAARLPPCSAASMRQSSAPAASSAVSGTVTSHAISCAESGASDIFRGAASMPGTRGVTATSILRSVVLRTVTCARNASPSRTSGGRPEISCRSCVLRIVALPVPKRSAPVAAIATIRKRVSASLSGTSTLALPFASSVTRGFHSNSVSNSSRVGAIPPPPPAGTALRPKWRRPTISICAVAVSTPYARRCSIASSRSQLRFGISSRSASSTAASAICVPAGAGLPSGSVTFTRACAVPRTG
ncbi:Uncharacterised protein [Burkholderia pseudomallei]|nr:Uncharacterised protein [Burkholderia pseudomallei]CAJ3857393.1 Uncharacterised protein [Burkholderia pseudomallei]CAJ5978238.1 Uncharacterised protein [Burkholderia pseudomallei]CAK0126327.1 Uncharacterised protein [Burkholderia pseudomallei]